MTSYVSQVRVQPPKEPRRSLARLGFSPLPPSTQATKALAPPFLSLALLIGQWVSLGTAQVGLGFPTWFWGISRFYYMAVMKFRGPEAPPSLVFIWALLRLTGMSSGF